MDTSVKVEEPGAAHQGGMASNPGMIQQPSMSPLRPGAASASTGTAPAETLKKEDPAEAEAAAKAAAEAAAELEARRAHEAAVLKEAGEIRDRRAWLRVTPYSEGKKGKTHWDHVLEEMVWLSKEFQRERRWKLQQARKTANQVARSNLDLESRVEVRAKEQEKALRKRASWIAKEVAGFWSKAQRVVQFKVRTEMEAKKKEVLDRQLDVLLGQTQKYSSLLAQRLTADEQPEAVALASKAEAPPAARAAAEAAAAPSPGVATAEVGPSTKGVASPQPLPSQRGTRGGPSSAAAAAAAAAQPPSAAVSGTAADGDDTKDYRSGEDDDADDEATLEEEERIAQAEGRDVIKDEKEEAEGLAEDADLPLELLLARYGYVVPTEEQAMEVEPAAPVTAPASAPSPTAAGRAVAVGMAMDEAASDAESEGIDALLRDDGGPGVVLPRPAPSRLAVEFADLSDEEGAGSVDAAMGIAGALPEDSSGAGPSRGPRRRGTSTTAAGRTGTAGDDEDEYRSGEDDDQDDEMTLEEEERLARLEGRDLGKDEKEEAAGLAEDADLPLEELLARYGYVVPQDEDEQEGQKKGADAGAGAGTSKAAAAAGTRPSGGDGGASGSKPASGQQPRRSTRAGGAAAPAQIAPDGPLSGAVAVSMDEDVEGDGGDHPEGIEGAVEAMAAAQPTGFTLDTTKVKTPVPFLLKANLREYQHIGLDWLVTLYHRRLNGILADEMGLGKTVQTIALLSWLACERGDWGPHLVVVPTSVMLNWEMEFKRFAPAFKLLTYYGSPKERAAKRQGWSKPNAFHVCITSYTLVLQDARMFKRKKWKYLVLDEAHMIKNWKSQRWQTLLNFNSKRRLLITGTPLQNDLMELWSLMHFLMPQVFGSHAQFKDWFSNPLTGMVEGSAEYNRAIVERLHAVLRPFLLRRMKRDVEKQLPGKHEHVIKCRLSKRQRQLYEEYMASGDTRATLQSGNFLGIMNCLMQLRKVCNHPDLFEGRPIVSAYDMQPLEIRMPSVVVDALEAGRVGGGTAALAAAGKWPEVEDLRELGLLPVVYGAEMEGWEVEEVRELALSGSAFDAPATTPQEDVALFMGKPGSVGSLLAALRRTPSQPALAAVAAAVQALAARRRVWRQERTTALGHISLARTSRMPSITADFAEVALVERAADHVHVIAALHGRALDYSNALRDMVKLPERRAEEMDTELKEFTIYIPKARAPPPSIWCSHPDSSAVAAAAARSRALQSVYSERSALLHVPRQRTQLFFPDKRLLQYDCGKLQELAMLLTRLKAGGHRALIFTQMSKMLDVLESFLNLHAYTYVRLDGSTKPEQRQILMQRFNTDPRIFVFILSTRSGGVGMNLTGADTVIFYDSDWNPAMDAQAQDRCHRIGQTREVHIYRLVSEHTIEENILKKSDQKRQLDFLAIQSGGFTTDFLTKFDPSALLEGTGGPGAVGGGGGAGGAAEIEAAMRAAEDEGDAAAAAAAEREVAAEMDEFIREPPPGGNNEAGEDGGGEDGNGGAPSETTGGDKEGTGTGTAEGGTSSAAAAAVVAGEDDEGFADVAAMAGAGAPGEDPMAHLQNALRPIERYAVRFVEDDVPTVDAEALAAQMEATYKVEEFDVDAIEAAEEEREAEIDDDEEANVVGDWDQVAATAAYAAQVEAVEAAEREREAAEAAWLAEYQAQYGTLPPLEPLPGAGGASAGRKSGGRGRGRPPSTAAGAGGTSTGAGGWGVEDGGDTAVSPGGTVPSPYGEDGPAGKRRKIISTGPPPQPWEPQEDFVLTSAVAMLLESGDLPGPGLWAVAADALGAGAAAVSVTGAEAAARQGRRRNADACGRRYAQLRAAYVAATSGDKENLARDVATVKAAVGAALGAAALPGPEADSLAAVYTVLTEQSSTSPLATALLEQLNYLRGAMAAGGSPLPPPPVEVPGAPVAGPLPQAQAIAAAVRQGCGSGAARVISQRLPGVIDAARAGGAFFQQPPAQIPQQQQQQLDGLPLFPGGWPSGVGGVGAAVASNGASALDGLNGILGGAPPVAGAPPGNIGIGMGGYPPII